MRDRTADLLRARQALSQLSYNPIVITFSETKLLLRTCSSLHDEITNAVTGNVGGSEWTRTTDLSLIRRTL